MATGPERRTRENKPASRIPQAIPQAWYSMTLKPGQASVFIEAGYPACCGFWRNIRIPRGEAFRAAWGHQLRALGVSRHRPTGIQAQANAPKSPRVRMTTHRAVLQPERHKIQSNRRRAYRAIFIRHPPFVLLNLGRLSGGAGPRRKIRAAFTGALRLWIQFKKVGSAKGFTRQGYPTSCTKQTSKSRPSERGEINGSPPTRRRNGKTNKIIARRSNPVIPQGHFHIGFVLIPCRASSQRITPWIKSKLREV